MPAVQLKFDLQLASTPPFTPCRRLVFNSPFYALFQRYSTSGGSHGPAFNHFLRRSRRDSHSPSGQRRLCSQPSAKSPPPARTPCSESRHVAPIWVGVHRVSWRPVGWPRAAGQAEHNHHFTQNLHYRVQFRRVHCCGNAVRGRMLVRVLRPAEQTDHPRRVTLFHGMQRRLHFQMRQQLRQQSLRQNLWLVDPSTRSRRMDPARLLHRSIISANVGAVLDHGLVGHDRGEVHVLVPSDRPIRRSGKQNAMLLRHDAE